MNEQEIRKLREQIVKEIEALFCNGSNGCYGVNKEHCDVVKECADIARGNQDEALVS